MVVRSAADLQLLRANPRAVRRLPSTGLEVAIAGLDAAHARRLEHRIRAYVRACGCAEGGAAALLGVLSTLAWVASHVAARGPQWSDLARVAVGVLLAVVLGGLGKLLGVAIARARFERCCVATRRALHAHGAAHGRTTP